MPITLHGAFTPCPCPKWRSTLRSRIFTKPKLSDVPYYLLIYLNEDLKLWKVCARFVSHSLNDDQKHARVLHAQEINLTALTIQTFWKQSWLAMKHGVFNSNYLQSDRVLFEKAQNSLPRKVRLQNSKVKTMPITFFDSGRMIHKAFVPKGSTVNGQYYLGVMQHLLARIRRVRPQYKARGSCSLLHDNAPAHKCIFVRNFLASKSVQVLDHPAYSPDLSPCDYFLFAKLKMQLNGLRFDTISEIQKVLTEALKTITKEEYQRYFQKLYDHSKHCISSKGCISNNYE